MALQKPALAVTMPLARIRGQYLGAADGENVAQCTTNSIDDAVRTKPGGSSAHPEGQTKCAKVV
jgi:hypothetical protein